MCDYIYRSNWCALFLLHTHTYIYTQVSVKYPFIFSDHMLPLGMFMVHDITFEIYRHMDER